MSPASRALGWLREHPLARAELVASAWEIFSALLFGSAVVPVVLGFTVTSMAFLGTLVLSGLLARVLLPLGARGFALAGALRALAWPLVILPSLHSAGPGALVAALAFGLMAGGIRRSIYRMLLDPVASEAELGQSLRPRLSEAATTVGIVGGHVMLLFSVAFLRTASQVIFEAWFEIVPALALLGTTGFTLAVRPATSVVLEALEAGEAAPPELLRKGLERARSLPERLSRLNFVLWLVCTTVGAVYVRPPTRAADAVTQIGFGALFAWGVSFYQRAWVADVCAPVVLRLTQLAKRELDEPRVSMRGRLLREFGLPLLFTCLLSLFSSIALYRALGQGLSLREDLNATVALFASFALLVLAAGGVVARAARELSRPIVEVATAADRVAHGTLDLAVPPVRGPAEVRGLGESVEGMRQALRRTIAELEEERRTLEAKVDARTAELKKALDELREAQAALIQGERLASIGELVSGVAHEIYNPLNAVAGASQPLEELVTDLRKVLDAYRDAERELPFARRRQLESLRGEVDLDASLDDLVGISSVVRRATARAVRIVSNLRSFSRPTGEPVPTDLHAGLDETLMLLAPRLRQLDIAVERRFGDVPQVTCRGGELNQVFLNLLVNAVQALEQAHRQASPRERAEHEPAIVIETRREGDLVRVAIADNGPGVPPDIAARIFDPFFTTKARGEGTGLGLSLSSQIVRRHGGSLTLERGPTSGACFVVRVPIGAPPARKSAPEALGPDDAA